MSAINFLDVVKRNNSDAAFDLLNEASAATPEVRIGAARSIKGFSFETLVVTALPTGSSFRKASEGVSYGKATRELREVKCYIMNKRWNVDKAVAMGSEDGPAALLAEEAALQMAAAMQDLGSQFYYGVSNDANGFAGLVASIDSTNMEVDATGTTAGTGSSVWAVRHGNDGVQWVIGDNGSMEPQETREGDITDANSKQYTALIGELLARPGLMIRSTKAIGRIKDLTEDSGKGLTDDLIDDLLGKFPAGKGPNAIYMTRRSAVQLKKSRTATSESGKSADWVTAIMGLDGTMIPVYVTDSITNIETLS